MIPPDASQRIPDIGDLVFLSICTRRFRPEIYEDLEDSDRPD